MKSIDNSIQQPVTLNTMIAEIERRPGVTFDIENRRHFFMLNEKIKRLHAEHVGLKHRIEAVLSGEKTYDPRHQKAIARPKNS